MYRKCRGALLEAADHLTFHNGLNHPRTMAVNNQLATLDYDFSLLKQAEDKIKPTIKLDAEGNSEGAKCHILLAKIALAKGELKRASTHIEKATSILKNSPIKFNDPEYDKVLMRHPLYLEISILRAKVYNRQQRHHLALKELQMLQRLVKLQKPYNVTLLANLEEEEAEILVCLGETQNFESCVLRSVQLREQAMGRFNIPNAISFSNLFKYLRYTNDFESSVKYHQKSTEIFSRFPPDHPNAWVMHLSNGLIFFQRKQF
jgi:tetratricopeptide (TPR) repeat protein